MKYTISVVPDDTARGCFMVVIGDEDNRLVGIPFRGETKADAERMCDPLRYAFEFGYGAAVNEVRNLRQHSRIERTP